MNESSFTIENGVLVRYSGSDESLVIPEGVSIIGQRSFFTPFQKRATPRKIIIPEGVKTIGREAFLWNSQLEEIILPASLERIEYGAFSGCGELKRVEISQPSNLDTIDTSAFDACSKLESINIPDETTVGFGAFSRCDALADENGWIVINGVLHGYDGEAAVVTIPDTVSVIGGTAFKYQGQTITTVVIPDSVKTIKAFAFSGCEKLTHLSLPDEIVIEDDAFLRCKGLANEEGMIIIHGNLCGYYGDSDNIVIPDGVTRISSGVFGQRQNIRSVVFPAGLIEIGDNAFGNCAGISSITLPDSLESIGKNAFRGTSISSVEIPENTKIIGDNAFESCSRLKQVIVKGHDTHISGTAFINCHSLQADDDGFIIIGSTLFRYLGKNNDVCVPDGVTIVGVSAFNNRNNVTSVKLPGSIAEINEMAFAYCSRLTAIELPDGIKEIESCTFLNCGSLSSIVLPASLTKFGSSAFSGCTSLTSITLPKECYSIGYRGFYNCSSLKEIIIEGTITEVGEDAFTGCGSLLNVLVDPALTSEVEAKIKTSLSWVNAPDALKKAAHKEATLSYAFSKKKRILPIIFDNDMVLALHTFAENGKITKKNVDEEFLNPAVEAQATQCTAFLMDWKSGNVSAKDAAKKLDRELSKDPFNATDMKKIWSYSKLEDGSLEITSYKGNDTAIVIPSRIGKDPVSRVGDYALSPLKKGRSQIQSEPLLRIKTAVISEGIKEIGRAALSGCSGLISVTLPDSLKRIDYLAFEGCSSLAEINLADGVEILGSAFSGCKGLADAEGFLIIRGSLSAYAGHAKELTTPSTVTSLAVGAFRDCIGLTKVRLPKNVGYIGAEAFDGCTALEEVTIENDCVFVGGNAFHNCRKLKAVYVPRGSTTESYVKHQCKKVKPI